MTWISADAVRVIEWILLSVNAKEYQTACFGIWITLFTAELGLVFGGDWRKYVAKICILDLALQYISCDEANNMEHPYLNWVEVFNEWNKTCI